MKILQREAHAKLLQKEQNKCNVCNANSREKPQCSAAAHSKVPATLYEDIGGTETQLCSILQSHEKDIDATARQRGMQLLH